ncbi:MAG TPA: protoporphyrinogen oxidase, partial [Thermoanaerobaculia bacterium]
MTAETADVLVLGSGITGLAAARALRRAGRSVVLVDPAPPGGTLQTVTLDGSTVELGPNTVQDSRELRELAEDAGCAGELKPAAPEAKRRYLVHQGALVALPGSPPALVKTPLLAAGAKLRLASEPFRRRGPGPDESVGAFFARRVGRATAALADAMVLGIYAGDPQELRIGYAFERVHTMEREHGSLFAALRRSKAPRPPLGA